MMERWWNEDHRFASALVASLVFHALLFALIPNVRSNAPAPDTLETISFTKIQHISVSAPHPAVAAHALATVAKTPVAPTPAPRAAKPRPAAHPVKQSRASVKPVPTPGARTPVNAFAVAKQAGTPAPVTNAAPAASAAAPVQTAAPQSVSRKQDQEVAHTTGTTQSGGAFAFGDTHDATLDPNVTKELKRRFKIHLELLVYVSDDGKTQRIEFHPSPGPDIEQQIRDLLKDAHWDAAVCGGGLTCESKATITLVE
jgi:hypothetical protein